MKPLKILNLATHDYGGAGIASVYINDLLLKAGHNSKLMVWEKKSKSENVIQCKLYSNNFISSKKYKKWVRKENRRWRKIESDYGFISKTVFDPQSSYVTAKSILSQIDYVPDLILLHWVSYFITPKIVNDLIKISGAKIAWLMMDNSPITGGCHYPFKCNGYQKGCDDCPLFSVKNDIAHNNLLAKASLLPVDLEFWGTSSDVQRARKSTLGKIRNVRTMIFPIDESLISNEARNDVRLSLGLPLHKKIILVGCTDLSDVRKGSEYLLTSLILLKERYPDLYTNVSLLLVGEYRSEILENIGYEVFALGRLTLAELMRAFNAADLFLSTSIEDSGPLMINQSMAAGTPVVAFDIGVAKDLIRPGYSGYKAKLGDVDELLEYIAEMLLCLDNKANVFNEKCKKVYSNMSSEISLLSCVKEIMYK